MEPKLTKFGRCTSVSVPGGESMYVNMLAVVSGMECRTKAARDVAAYDCKEMK